MKLNKIYWLFSFVCVLSAYGCSDDSDDKKPEEKTAACKSNRDCDSGKCLDNGECAGVVKLGEKCDSEHICEKALVCIDGECREKTEDKPGDDVDKPNDDEPECSVDKDCKMGQVCVKDACTEIQYLEKGSTCKTTDKTRGCKDGLICWSGKCWDENELISEEKCQSDADCAKEDVYKNCMSDGSCGLILGLGDDCSDERSVCADGMICDFSVCSKVMGEGESCADTDLTVCDEGLRCIDDILECHKPENNLSVGNPCNDKWLICEKSLSCMDGICSVLGDEEAECDESRGLFCKNGLLCVNSQCTPVGDSCRSSADCLEKDSFCCLSDTCGVKGKCVPYDESTKFDETCGYRTKAGIFEAQVQCRWTAPNDEYKSYNNVEMTPLVGHFGNKDNLMTTILFWSNGSHSVMRIINPETCETLETIEYKTASGETVGFGDQYDNNPAAADLDGDGLMEFVAVAANHYLVAYKWNEVLHKHEVLWTSSHEGGGFPAIVDVNGDGKAEVVGGTNVFDGATGRLLNTKADKFDSYNDLAIGIWDNDAGGRVSLIANYGSVYKWNETNNGWTKSGSVGGSYTGYADFGTPGATAGDFDFTKLDGRAELVSGASIYAQTSDGNDTYKVQKVFESSAFDSGGPVTIGDFDNDGLPEIGIASEGAFTIYDPRCKGYEAGKCADQGVLWRRWSQDESSGRTGSTLFDFDGDGQAEAVYGDECFTRVYDGKTGRVLFSSKRSSGTWSESAIVADVDGDGSAEIVMGSTSSQTCYDDSNTRVRDGVDPIHQGIRCENDADCPSGKGCDSSLGLCTCTSDAECNTLYSDGKLVEQYVCTDQIHKDIGMMENRDGTGLKIVKEIGTRPDGWTSASPRVCRATRKASNFGSSDLVIYRDRLDRWVSSRNIWSNHAYNIINIEDDGKVPTAAQWLLNWAAKSTGLTILDTGIPRPRYNSYRLNRQGEFGSGAAPDITGRFIAGSICGTTNDGRHVISGKLCNRGTKPVAMLLPATFFYYDENTLDHRGEKICTSYTKSNVGVGECAQVGCTVSVETLNALRDRKVLMVTNLDEHGNASTVECNDQNNTDTITIESCEAEDIEIVN